MTPPAITAERAANAAAGIVAIANERLLDLADRPATRDVLRQALQAEADALCAFIDQHRTKPAPAPAAATTATDASPCG